MIDLLLSLVDLKQCEVVIVAIQRANIHETDTTLPLLDSPFAVEAFNYLPQSSQGLGDTPAKSLELV